ncbi:MAG TPA: GrpB family protein [Dehalococcoidia bacterium]|nr:GrpB family protein [Dehalococcoidia bacterium]
MTRPTGAIVLVPHDPAWTAAFEEERARIQEAIGQWAADVQHVGSTSIPGIAAKPIIDIAVHLRSITDALYCITPLVQIGYECLGEFGIPGRIYFRKPTKTPLPGQSHYGVGRTHQIHMYETGHEQYEKQITFRDYLRKHPESAREYEDLKRDLAARHDDIEDYALGKSEFVLHILALAGASKEIPGTEEKAATAPRPSSHAAERGSPPV